MGACGLKDKMVSNDARLNVEQNIATFGMLISLYQKGGSVEEAEFTFSLMRNLKLPRRSVSSFFYHNLYIYAKAEDVIGFLREDELFLLIAYCQQCKLIDAEAVLCAMREAGFSPIIIAYKTMITGYGKVSRMDQAELLFLNMRKLGLEPDETTYRPLIKGWGPAGNYKQAKLKYINLTMLGFKLVHNGKFTGKA